MQYDLIVRKAQLLRRQGLVDLAIHDGHFVRIGEDLADEQARREIDVAGRLVTPPFIDAHVHLDAVLTVGQPRYNNTGTLLEGIQIWSERKPGLTREDVRQRALEEIRWEVAQGTLYIRSHVDVCDPELTALRALLEVREEVRDICELHLLVPQWAGADAQGAGAGLRRCGRNSPLRMDARYGRGGRSLCLRAG